MKPYKTYKPYEVKKIKREQEDLSESFLVCINRIKPNLIKGMKREHLFHTERKWRFDLAWPDHMVAVECDGGQYQYMGGRHNTDGDRDKINTATMMGWSVLRFSGAQINNDPINCLNIVEKTIKNSCVLS